MTSKNYSNNSLRWLIVEDALKNKSGHWFEYIGTFWRGLQQLRDEVTILVDRDAEDFILKSFEAVPILPPSIWHRMSDNAHPLIRYLRIPIHAWKTFWSVRKFLRRSQLYDVIFVPTVSVHHLLAWVFLVKLGLTPAKSKVILFFLSVPVNYCTNTQSSTWDKSPTAYLIKFLLRFLKTDLTNKNVILGVDTYSVRASLTCLTRLNFTYFPQPVEPSVQENFIQHEQLVIASYGSARHEKGSDILYRAIADFSRLYHRSSVRFILQYLGGFDLEKALLQKSNNIHWIEHYFDPGEYSKYLAMTHIMILPYRSSSYALRSSRVVIEAMINGIPIIATEGTTLADQAREFGSVITCENENYQSLSQAIQIAVENYDELKAIAQTNKLKAQFHFSVKFFRDCLLT